MGVVYDLATGQTTTTADAPATDAAEALAMRRAAMVLTDIQFALACTLAGHMTAAEAEAWVGQGAIPPLALDALALIPDAQTRTLARIRFAGARTIARLDPFIPLLQASAALTDGQVDTLFTTGAAL